MPGTHTAVSGPIDSASPAGYQTIAVKINPGAFFKNKAAITDADYRVPPFTLLFAKDEPPQTRGYAAKRIIHLNKRARREPPVQDVLCNAYNISENARDERHVGNIRFFAVSYDGIVGSREARLHPDHAGRFSAIISGKVTITCCKEDLQDIGIGELIAWDYRDNGQVYHGLPQNWSTFKLVPATRALSSSPYNRLDVPYYGKSSHYSGNDAPMSGRSTYYSDGATRRGIRPEMWDESGQEHTGGHIATQAGDVTYGPEEVVRHNTALQMALLVRLHGMKLASRANPVTYNWNGLTSAIDRRRIVDNEGTVKESIGVYAQFFLCLVGAPEPEKWVDGPSGLYNPTSSYWCEEPLPDSSNSVKWIDDFIGYSGILPVSVDTATKKYAFTEHFSSANTLCGGRSLGWLHRVIVPLLDTRDDYGWAWASATKRDEAVKAAKSDPSVGKDLQEAYGSYMSTDTAFNHMKVAATDGEDGKAIREYTMALLRCGTNSNQFAAAVAACHGMYKTDSDGSGCKNIAWNIAVCGKTSAEFEEMRYRAREHLTTIIKLPFEVQYPEDVNEDGVTGLLDFYTNFDATSSRAGIDTIGGFASLTTKCTIFQLIKFCDQGDFTYDESYDTDTMVSVTTWIKLVLGVTPNIHSKDNLYLLKDVQDTIRLLSEGAYWYGCMGKILSTSFTDAEDEPVMSNIMYGTETVLMDEKESYEVGKMICDKVILSLRPGPVEGAPTFDELFTFLNHPELYGYKVKPSLHGVKPSDLQKRMYEAIKTPSEAVDKEFNDYGVTCRDFRSNLPRELYPHRTFDDVDILDGDHYDEIKALLDAFTAHDLSQETALKTYQLKKRFPALWNAVEPDLTLPSKSVPSVPPPEKSTSSSKVVLKDTVTQTDPMPHYDTIKKIPKRSARSEKPDQPPPRTRIIGKLIEKNPFSNDVSTGETVCVCVCGCHYRCLTCVCVFMHRQRFSWDSEVYAHASVDTVPKTEHPRNMHRTMTSVLWWWVATAVCANHGVEVQTLVDENYTRYAVFQLGARPGSPVLFQINFGSTAANVLPGSALQHSQTYTIVDESTVTEYVYFEGQEILIRGEFRVGDAGVLNTGTLNVSFCYRHVYETMWLMLGVGCGDMSRRDRDTGLDAPLRAVYPNVTSSLAGAYPMRWEPGRSTCNESVRASFQDVFYVNGGCDWPFVDDVALDVEHNVDTNVLSIFQATHGTDDTTAVALIGLLVVFLTTWVYWMRDLHQAVRYSITREHLQGNAVHFGKVVQHALGRETFSEYVQQLWYDTSGALLEPEYTPKINPMDIQVAASNHVMVWATVSRFSVIIIDVVVLVGTWSLLFFGGGGGGGGERGERGGIYLACIIYFFSFGVRGMVVFLQDPRRFSRASTSIPICTTVTRSR